MPGFNHDDWTEEETQIFAGIIDVAVPFSYDIDREIPTESNNDIVERLIENKSLNLVYGKKNAGKSLVIGDLAIHLSKGAHWAGRNTKPCEVFYYAYEQPEHLRIRFRATHNLKFPNDTEYLDHLLFSPKPPDILGKHYENALKFKVCLDDNWPDSEILDENSGRVLILDTLAYVIGDKGDENAFSTIGPLVKQLRKIIDLGWTIFVLTHPGKDASKGPRGHSALPAAADNIFHITQKNGTITMHQNFARNRKTGQNLKFKILSSNLKERGLEGIPYIEALNEEKAHVASPKPSLREVAVLNLLGQLFEADPVNIKLVFGLDRDSYAVQHAQLLAAFIAANIAPQAESKASQAKALTRVLESLAEKDLINERGGFYWLPENEQTNDDNQS